MSKDQSDFFKELKPWTRFKNFILGYYLGPYLQKVKGLRKPILLVDCCSGPGKFEDGNSGSPLIMAEHLKKMKEQGVSCGGIFIERNKKWHQDLTTNLAPYSDYCTPKHGDFKDFWNEINEYTKTHTVFVYVDPFGVEDLVFGNILNLLSAISRGSSVELLLNWNCIGFLRWGSQCIKGGSQTDQIFSTIDAQYIDEAEPSRNDEAILNEIANGSYWKDILNARNPIDLSVSELEMATTYLKQFPGDVLKGNYPIVPRYGLIPKYHMIFATGHPEGLDLMNDTMAKARSKSLHEEFIEDFLFDMTPDAVRNDYEALSARILSLVRENPDQLFQPDIKLKLISQFGMFAKYENKMFTQALRDLRKNKQITPDTGLSILKVRYRAV